MTRSTAYEQLVRAARAGDRQAFEAAYDKVGLELLNYLQRRYPCQDPEDLLQELMTQVMLNADACRPASAVGWVYTIARHLGLRRGQQADRRASEEAFGGRPEGEAPTPEALAGAGEARARVRAALAALAPVDRAVLSLWQDAWSQQDMAEAFGCSVTTINMRVYRAKQRLRVQLGLVA